MEGRIVDPVTGQVLGPNHTGELWLKGPSIMKGYFSNEEATSSTLDSEGWLRTRDLCYIDEDGFIFVVDRLKELIKYKGYQARETETQRSEFSFVNCTIDGTGKVLLGRAWRDCATVVFSRTNMSKIISPEGWSDSGNVTNDKTVTFGEHRCFGEGANDKVRVSYAKLLTDSEASAFTSISYIDGDHWLNHTDILSKLNIEELKEDLISSY